MFEESSYPDKIEVLHPQKTVQVRLVNEVRKDGVVIASSYSRYILENGDDLSGQPVEVTRICDAVWL